MYEEYFVGVHRFYLGGMCVCGVECEYCGMGVGVGMGLLGVQEVNMYVLYVLGRVSLSLG